MIRFTKMQGIGNDYVYVDGYGGGLPGDPARLAVTLADRHFGIGGDGLILVLPPSDGVDADVRMRMFNADGSEAEMCGNGVRCVCKYAHDHGHSSANPMRVETGRGVLELRYTVDAAGAVDRVTVDMGAPVLAAASIPIELPDLAGDARVVDHPLDIGAAAGGLRPAMTGVSMGNPHVIFYADDAAAVPLETIGPRLENHAAFPNRINVHVVQVIDDGEVIMRTWERGSGITMACGTGAAAVCVAGVLTGRTGRRLLAHLPGGDLDLLWDDASDHVFKTGPAREVFRGEWSGDAGE